MAKSEIVHGSQHLPSADKHLGRRMARTESAAYADAAGIAADQAMPRRLLRTPDAAKYLGFSESTMEKRRVRGERPHYIKLGGKLVVYELSELDAYISDCRRTSTSDV